jgi:hypothetical protein
MTSRRILALLVAAGLSLGAAPPLTGESVLAREPPELVERLQQQGLVVMEDVANPERASFVIAYVIFAQPRERTIALVTNPKRQTEWRTDLKSVETISTMAHTRVDEIRMRVLFRDLVYRVKYQRDPETDRISWELDPSFENALARFEGFWEFYPMTQGMTLGRFGTRVDAGAAFPAFLQRDLTRRSVVGTMGNCRKWVDSNGAWRP